MSAPRVTIESIEKDLGRPPSPHFAVGEPGGMENSLSSGQPSYGHRVSDGKPAVLIYEPMHVVTDPQRLIDHAHELLLLSDWLTLQNAEDTP